MELRTATIDGMSMTWLDAALRPRDGSSPVVLIHGIPTGPLLWREVIPRLEGARCLAWEMVGYGTSIGEGRERDIGVSAQADYLARWLRHLGIDRAVLAGHDLGGAVAQIAALRQRDLCAGLFLTNATGYDAWLVPSVRALQALGRVVRTLPDPVFKVIFRSLLRRGHDSGAQADAAVEVHWPHYARHGAAAAFIRQVNALDGRDTLAVADRLQHLGVPARIVWGTADPFNEIGRGERFARDLRAPLRQIDGARHFTPEDHPDIVAAEINLLLEEVLNASRPRP